MSYIPQEILDIIIRCASEQDFGWYFCQRVSRTFHQIVLPYKFRSVTFKCLRRPLSGRWCYALVIPIPKFCEAINDGDAHALSLAPLVQELNLLWWSGKDGFNNNLLLEPFEKIINNVFSFRNLTKLNMQKCVTTPAIMEQLGKLVQLQSLHTYRCQDEKYGDKPSYGALSNLQSLHTLESDGDWHHFCHHLACISMKHLRILKSSDLKVTEALLKTDPSVQLKELWLTSRSCGDYSLLWNYLARVTSLTHLSLRHLRLTDGPPSLIFPFRELQYLHIHVAFAPRFADLPLKKMEIYTESDPGQLMEEVRQHWQGIVFPCVEYLETDRLRPEMVEIPIEFWREFLPMLTKCGEHCDVSFCAD